MRTSVLTLGIVCAEGVLVLPIASIIFPIQALGLGIGIVSCFILPQLLIPIILFCFEQKFPKFRLPEKRWLRFLEVIGLGFFWIYFTLFQLDILASTGCSWAEHALISLFEVFS